MTHRQLCNLSEKEVEHHFQHTKKMPSSPPAATGETDLKQEPATDDHDVFAAFANKALHKEEDAETKQAPSDVNSPVEQVPIHKILSVSWRTNWTWRNVRTTHRQLRDMSEKEFNLHFHWDVGRRDVGGTVAGLADGADENITLASLASGSRNSYPARE